jgi:hypothetical protein
METTELAEAVKFAAVVIAAAYLAGKLFDFVQWVIVSIRPLPPYAYELDNEDKGDAEDAIQKD